MDEQRPNAGGFAMTVLFVAVTVASCALDGADDYHIEGDEEPLAIGELRTVRVLEVFDGEEPGDGSVECRANDRAFSKDEDVAVVESTKSCTVTCRGLSPGHAEIVVDKNRGGRTSFSLEVVYTQ